LEVEMDGRRAEKRNDSRPVPVIIAELFG